jgi:hypothetical protein
MTILMWIVLLALVLFTADVLLAIYQAHCCRVTSRRQARSSASRQKLMAL